MLQNGHLVEFIPTQMYFKAPTPPEVRLWVIYLTVVRKVLNGDVLKTWSPVPIPVLIMTNQLNI